MRSTKRTTAIHIRKYCPTCFAGIMKASCGYRKCSSKARAPLPANDACVFPGWMRLSGSNRVLLSFTQRSRRIRSAASFFAHIFQFFPALIRHRCLSFNIPNLLLSQFIQVVPCSSRTIISTSISSASHQKNDLPFPQ